MKKLLFLILFLLVTKAISRENPLFDRNLVPYSDGRLSVSAVGNFTHYFGEFENNTGNSIALETKYTMPYLPELSFGARYSQGYLSYLRGYKDNFTSYFEQQFPSEFYPDAINNPVQRRTDISTVEVLAFLNLFPRERLNYYLFAGIGLLRFQPQDIKEAPQTPYGTNLLWSDFGDEDQFKPTIAGGIGADFYVTRNFSVGVQASYRYFKTDLLDGFQFQPNGQATANDHFFDYGIKFSYYMFESTDSDGDGISNEEEIAYGTNPYKADTDGDGLTDYEEIYIYKTSPVLADTDGDGLNDNEEITLNLNPNNPDTDGDGLTDYEEVKIYKTFAHLPDSDFDGISDYNEIRSNTNPMNRDTDGDGIPDGEDECPNAFGLELFKGCPQTEPIVETRIIKDTLIIPMDTIYIVKEYVPATKDSIYKQVLKPFGINFMKNSSEILVESEIILDDIAKWIVSQDKQVEVHGHTDTDGDSNFNLYLSEARAKSVQQYLIEQGVDPNKINARGFGSNHPIDFGESKKSKARNRRIEFVITDEITKK
jgi:outer membrane protein OmpA-like peptidoglycan-associated protein/opacity protein-like surface antigen